MNERKFKVGDRVRMKENCSECVEGKTYTIHDRIFTSKLTSEYVCIWSNEHNPETLGSCICTEKWELVSSQGDIEKVEMVNYRYDEFHIVEFRTNIVRLAAKVNELVENFNEQRTKVIDDSAITHTESLLFRKVQAGDNYYYFNDEGNLGNCRWDTDKIDYNRFKHHNVFQSEEDANKYKSAIETFIKTL